VTFWQKKEEKDQAGSMEIAWKSERVFMWSDKKTPAKEGLGKKAGKVLKASPVVELYRRQVTKRCGSITPNVGKKRAKKRLS